MIVYVCDVLVLEIVFKGLAWKIIVGRARAVQILEISGKGLYCVRVQKVARSLCRYSLIVGSSVYSYFVFSLFTPISLHYQINRNFC